jgi:pimeloyl-ACP methyl ester carboxylesterase
MGGLLASAHAVLRPGAFKKLVFLAAPPAWEAPESLPGPFKPFESALLGRLVLGLGARLDPASPFGVRRAYTRLFRDPGGHEAARAVELLRESGAILRERAHRRAFVATMAEHVRRIRSGGLAAWREGEIRLGRPALFLAGAEDPLFPLETIRAGAERCSDAGLEVLSPCGHFPTWEQPEAVAASVRRFLA